MPTTQILLNTVALDPNRWSPEKIPFFALDDLVAPIRRHGFTHLEVWQYHISHLPSPALSRVRRLLHEAGLATRVVGLYPTLHEVGVARQRSLDEARRVLECASVLGADTVKIFVGNRASSDLSVLEYERSIDFLRELTAEAGRAKITITGETHENTLFDDIRSIGSVFADVAADNFKICFQPLDFGDTAAAIELYVQLRQHVVHVHLQGRRDGNMTFLEDAEIDYESLIRAFTREAFSGYLSIEFVRDCIVEKPSDIDLERVLGNAARDRLFIEKTARMHGLLLEHHRPAYKIPHSSGEAK